MKPVIILAAVVVAAALLCAAYLFGSQHPVVVSPNPTTIQGSVSSTSIAGTQNPTTTTSPQVFNGSTEYLGPEYAHWFGNVTTTIEGDYLIVKSNGVPTEAGTFPNQYNPNKIVAQNYSFEIPLHPQIAPHNSPIPIGGPIGVALNGVPFFGPYTATGQIAVLVEHFDMCNGHPDMNGMYHYHEFSPCLANSIAGQHSPLIGFAFDGFPIYGPDGANGIPVPQNSLDSCNGRYDPEVGSYIYVATNSFPYLLGCYSGTPASADLNNPSMDMK